jgi:DNA-binding transcriptional MerR regulator
MEFITTGGLSRLTGLSIPTILEYEKRGLITSQRDTAGRRIFSKDAVQRILKYKKKRRKT